MEVTKGMINSKLDGGPLDTNVFVCFARAMKFSSIDFASFFVLC